jgi:cytochrome c553
MKRLFLWGVVVPALFRRLLPAWFFESPILLAARHPWITLAIVAAALGAGGLAVAASGVIAMRASTGHFPITERFLHFSMRRSIVTNATPIETPPLDDLKSVVRGAGHYDVGCRPCHGGAEGDTPRVPRHMEPPPRALRVHAADWRDRELYYIVRHGMKFTGMPAWPAQQRDDEVWDMVAFVRRLPGLSREEYARLTRGDPDEPLDLGTADVEPPRIVIESCARCHGTDGDGRGGAFPRLAGQRAEYLEDALRAYAGGGRYSGIMGTVAASLTSDARDEAVRHYASLAPATPAVPRDSARVTQGQMIATRGIGDRIPACVECHGPAATPKNPAYPRLAGQYPDYLARQLRLFQQRRRGGSEYVHLMHAFVDRLTREQIEDVALYFGSLQSSSDSER